jgi:predicted acylesterase/phospholipase RssA
MARRSRATKGTSDPQGAQVAPEVLKSVAELLARNPNVEINIGERDEKPPKHYDGPKRALCLGGGGPALGLHIGALKALENCDNVDFRNERAVWALSCIGAWVGVVYNQIKKEGREGEETHKFFRDVFRDDESYHSFPINTIFAPDWIRCAEAAAEFLLDPCNYRNAFLPRHFVQSYLYTLSRLCELKRWGKFSEGDFNRWTFNHFLAVHPLARFVTAFLYKSRIDGRARLFYEDSQFLNDIKFKRLDEPGKPFIFHNAFNFGKNDIDMFANNAPKWGRKNYKALTPASLCACSALPFVEEVVHIGGEAYCEGALVDTVNFRTLLQEHHRWGGKENSDDNLEEIWVSRIVDVRQIRQPSNQHDALGNLCQMFAATVGEDDIKLFKHYVRENNRRIEKGEPDPAQILAQMHGQKVPPEVPRWQGILVEIPVDETINYEWSRANLERSVERGAIAGSAVCKLYDKYKHKIKDPKKHMKEWQRGVLVIPEDLSNDEIRAADLNEDEIKVVLDSRRRRGQRRRADAREDEILAVLTRLGLTPDRIRAMPAGRWRC